MTAIYNRVFKDNQVPSSCDSCFAKGTYAKLKRIYDEYNAWKEEDLFNYLLENVYPDLVKSNSPFSKWDCYSPINWHRIELKCRSSITIV